MDKLSRYREIIKRLLNELAEPTRRNPTPGVEDRCVFDDAGGDYLLLSVGWQGDRRQRGTHVYIRLRDEKVWIEDDWTNAGVAERLLRAGIPKEDIVLGFHAPATRKLTEFAVA